jgi:hypothetical protein
MEDLSMYYCVVLGKIVSTSKAAPTDSMKMLGNWLRGLTINESFDPDTHSRLGPTLIVMDGYIEVKYTLEPRNNSVELKQSTVQGLLNEEFSNRSKAVSNGYSDNVIRTWPQQDKEARDLDASSTASTPMLDGMSTGRGMDKVVLKDRILANSSAYSSIVGDLLGRMQAIEDMIYVDGVTVEELIRISNEEVNSGW